MFNIFIDILMGCVVAIALTGTICLIVLTIREIILQIKGDKRSE